MIPSFIITDPSRPPHRYLKAAELVPYKNFILEKLQAGMQQKGIIDALETERGISIQAHALKRILDQWGSSNKNLTKKRKPLSEMVFENGEMEIKSPTRSDTKVKMIGVKETPGDVVLSTPTPRTVDSEAVSLHDATENASNGDFDFGSALDPGSESPHDKRGNGADILPQEEVLEIRPSDLGSDYNSSKGSENDAVQTVELRDEGVAILKSSGTD
ncbi:hypothetical protein TWF694_003331 [Orbilia ellipsospora]|uniref:Clr5 domain-containing protein n=1 Tax=Orbilia ellipsospora TaxID=2528407 RepID=A0AAV9X2G6_9PEZI